jgi:hypothetical protein
MKKLPLMIVALSIAVTSCQKSTTQQSVSLTASSKVIAPGETVTIKANIVGANTISWMVSPVAHANGIYSISTETTNYYQFDTAGIYTIAVNTRNLPFDTIHHCDPDDFPGHHLPDSLWNHHVGDMWHDHDGDFGGGGCNGHGGHGGHGGFGCHLGQDSASVVITVRNP